MPKLSSNLLGLQKYCDFRLSSNFSVEGNGDPQVKLMVQSYFFPYNDDEQRYFNTVKSQSSVHHCILLQSRSRMSEWVGITWGALWLCGLLAHPVSAVSLGRSREGAKNSPAPGIAHACGVMVIMWGQALTLKPWWCGFPIYLVTREAQWVHTGSHFKTSSTCCQLIFPMTIWYFPFLSGVPETKQLMSGESNTMFIKRK